MKHMSRTNRSFHMICLFPNIDSGIKILYNYRAYYIQDEIIICLAPQNSYNE